MPSSPSRWPYGGLQTRMPPSAGFSTADSSWTASDTCCSTPAAARLSRTYDNAFSDASQPKIRPGHSAWRAVNAASRSARERRRVVTQPILEPKPLPQEPGRTVRRHQRRFDQEGARTAGRIHQREALASRLRPTRQIQDRRRQVLLERRLSALLPVAPSVEPFPRKIEGKLVMRLADVQVKPDRRVPLVDARARARMVAKAVDDRVLCALHPVVRREWALRSLGATDREGLRRVEMLPPGNPAERIIESRVVVGIELDERQQDPRCDTGPEAQPVTLLQGAASVHRGGPHVRDLDVEVPHLLGERVLAALGARKHPPESLRE